MTLIYIFITVMLLLLIAAAFAKKDFVVQRELDIPKNAQEIFSFIKYLNNHKCFSKWVTKHAANTRGTRGTDGTVGFVQPWNNYPDKAGIGELEIKAVTTNEKVHLLHHYFKPIKGLGESEIIIRQNGHSGSLVKWQYTGHTKFPLNLITSIINMDKIVGKDLDQCLNRLKEQLTINKP
jgi:hypothetical protein